MKTLTNLIKESLQNINEGKFPKIDIETFIQICNGDQDYIDEYEIDQKTIDFLDKHCRIIERGGGYDGDGSSCFDTLYNQNVDVNSLYELGDDFDWDNVDGEALHDLEMNLFNDGECGQNILDACKNTFSGFKPKMGGTWFTAGYESPTIVLFDQKNALAKQIINSIEGWY